jgi:hypothetical protein
LEAIFTVDHVLSIQLLSSHYLLEYERKKEIVRSVISCVISNDASPAENMNGLANTDDAVGSDRGNSLSSISLPWIKSEEIDKIISIWGDDSDQSIIDTEAGNDFISAV